MKTFFMRYLRLALILCGISTLIIIFMFFVSIKSVSYYNSNLKACLENSDYESINGIMISSIIYEDGDKDINYFDITDINLLKTLKGEFSFSLYYLDNKLESYLMSASFLTGVMCILFSIYAFNDERKDFLKVLPVRREKIYITRAITSLLIVLLIFVVFGVFLSLIYRTGHLGAQNILSEYFGKRISVENINISSSFSTALCLCLLGSGFLSLLHTIFSKANFCFIAGMAGIILLFAGLAGFFSFAYVYDLAFIDKLDNAVENLFYYIDKYLMNVNLTHKTQVIILDCVFIVFTLIFTLLGTLLYKIGRAENRKGFFMFAPAKYIVYTAGSIFGGFAFFEFLTDADFLERMSVSNSVFSGITVVVSGMIIVYLAMKKTVELCE